MKKTGIVLALAVALVSCSGDANDGDAATDTTTMPIDTNMQNSTSDHINHPGGINQLDSTGRDTTDEGLFPDSLRQRQ